MPVRTGNFMGQVGFGSFATLGLETLTSAPPEREKYYVALEVGEVCQLKCKHCIYHRQKAQSPAPSEVVFTNIVSAMARGFDPIWVSLAGKEPTIFPRALLELASATRRPERLNILMTNGLRLNGGLARQLSELIDNFDISLDGEEGAHDWMRGRGSFRKTWNNLSALHERYPNRIGIIATAVHGSLPDGRDQHSDIVALARRLRDRFGTDGRLSLSLSLYYDSPDHPMLLDADDIIALMRNLQDTGFPTRVLVTANYAHLWPAVRAGIGWENLPIEYDARTGIPLVKSGSLSAVLFNLTETPQLGIRISNEGLVYVGCNHLALGDRAAPHCIGDLAEESLVDVIDRIANNTQPLISTLAEPPSFCQECDNWPLCRGGDRLSGVYFCGRPLDPYCPLVDPHSLPNA